MNIRINSVVYIESWDRYGITMNVDFTINNLINSNITIYDEKRLDMDEKRLDMDEIINYIRRELEING